MAELDETKALWSGLAVPVGCRLSWQAIVVQTTRKAKRCPV